MNQELKPQRGSSSQVLANKIIESKLPLQVKQKLPNNGCHIKGKIKKVYQFKQLLNIFDNIDQIEEIGLDLKLEKKEKTAFQFELQQDPYDINTQYLVPKKSFDSDENSKDDSEDNPNDDDNKDFDLNNQDLDELFKQLEKYPNLRVFDIRLDSRVSKINLNSVAQFLERLPKIYYINIDFDFPEVNIANDIKEIFEVLKQKKIRHLGFTFNQRMSGVEGDALNSYFQTEPELNSVKLQFKSKHLLTKDYQNLWNSLSFLGTLETHKYYFDVPKMQYHDHILGGFDKIMYPDYLKLHFNEISDFFAKSFADDLSKICSLKGLHLKVKYDSHSKNAASLIGSSLSNSKYESMIFEHFPNENSSDHLHEEQLRCFSQPIDEQNMLRSLVIIYPDIMTSKGSQQLADSLRWAPLLQHLKLELANQNSVLQNISNFKFLATLEVKASEIKVEPFEKLGKALSDLDYLEKLNICCKKVEDKDVDESFSKFAKGLANGKKRLSLFKFQVVDELYTLSGVGLNFLWRGLGHIRSLQQIQISLITGAETKEITGWEKFGYLKDLKELQTFDLQLKFKGISASQLALNAKTLQNFKVNPQKNLRTLLVYTPLQDNQIQEEISQGIRQLYEKVKGKECSVNLKIRLKKFFFKEGKEASLANQFDSVSLPRPSREFSFVVSGEYINRIKVLSENTLKKKMLVTF